jgi:hypothetical protein
VILELRTPKEKSGTMDPLFRLGRALESPKNRVLLSYLRLTMVKKFFVKFLKR